MGIFSAKMTLKDRYWFGGFSGTPPSEPNLSTPPGPHQERERERPSNLTPTVQYEAFGLVVVLT